MKLGLSALALATVTACAASSPPPPAATTTTSSALVAPAESAELDPTTVGCEVVCDGARVDEPDHHAAAVADADRVIASMEDDLLACYRQRLATNPRAQASLTFDIVLEPDGRVRRVDTTGGAMLGPKAMACMTERMERAAFAPVHGGGTLRIHVPITLRTNQNP